MPLGTLKITEVKNSLGYTVINTPLYCTIAADASAASGAKHVWSAESKAILLQMANGDWGVYEPIEENKSKAAECIADILIRKRAQ